MQHIDLSKLIGDFKMTNIHHLDTLPSQNTINLIASYSQEFDNKRFNYQQLLTKIHATIVCNHFMEQQDNARWMIHQGNDYINNPMLFRNAPLTYICAFLSELFKRGKVKDIEKKISPNIIKAALKRLTDFKKSSH